MIITHKKVVTGDQNPAFQVSKDEWNDLHEGGTSYSCIASDYPELDITNTTEDTLHEYYFIKSATINVGSIEALAEGKSAASQHTYLYVYVDDVLRITLDWNNETSLTIKTGAWDASGLANGKHKITIKKKVSGGTGTIQMFENWVGI